MRDRPDFKQTQEISLDVATQIGMMDDALEVAKALRLHIPWDATNVNHHGVPKVSRDGVDVFDSEFLVEALCEAISQNNPSLVPDVLNLRQAVKNILKTKTTVTRSRDTLPDIDENAVRAALTPARKIRNPELSRTTRYTPINPDEKP